MTSKVKPETYIRSMPFGIFRQLSYILDLPNPLHRNWEGLAALVPKSRGSDQMKYSQHQILMFQQELHRPNGSPTISLLQDWGTQNATAQDLVDILLRMELYSAAEVVLPEYTRVRREQQQESQFNVDYVPQHPTPDTTFASKLTSSVHSDTSSSSSMVTSSSSNDVPDCPMQSPETSMTSEPVQSGAVSSPSSNSAQKMENLQITNDETQVENTNDGTQVENVDSSTAEETFSESEREATSEAVSEAKESLQSVSEATEFLYSVLDKMTNDFNAKPTTEGGNRIGEGAFGEVFIGTLEDGKRVAVKKLKEGHMLYLKKVVNQFKTEVEVLSRYKHKNIVNFLGYSCDGHRFCLVYEYMPNGSLQDRLCCSGGTPPLEWKLRLNIARDVARGICYLHEKNLVHRDIKSANVLLDEDFVGKVSDFGLVRSGPTDPNMSVVVTTTVFGTSPYMPKEAFQGQITPKLDTFSYGVVLLEMMTGLPAYDEKRDSRDLPSHVEDFCDSDEDFLSIVDISLQYDDITMSKLYQVASECVNEKRRRRPAMSEVLPKIELIAASE